MQQKIQFASAVIHEPDLVVLDEPFTGLDPVNTRLLKELILEQRERGTTVVLSTHRMEQVEALCESICLIDRGRPVLSGVLADIKAGYGRNTIDLEYHGTPGALAGLPGVRRCEDTGHEARLELEPDADAQVVIRALLDRVEVQAVRLEHPHIEEIYLEKVGHQAIVPDTTREAVS
jgi:ABC-2 type transport system ATP-binding protein